MADEIYDVIVVGGGHNGLIVASYLAKAKLDVCVIERSDMVGGGVCSRELTAPGFKNDMFSMFHNFIQRNPLITHDELGLQSKYGLNYIYPEPIYSFIFPDGKNLVIYHDINKTCESMSKLSQKDADIYPDFCEYAAQMGRAMVTSNFSPPPNFGHFVSQMEESEAGRECMRVMMLSTMDILDEWFESEYIKLAFARHATATMVGPRERGTGWNCFYLANVQRGRGAAIPQGGSGALSNALEACLKDFGGAVRLSSTVKTIKVDRGEAKGVVLENGEEILARKAVVSNLNVKQLFLDMLNLDALPSGFPDKIRKLKSASFSAIHQSLALNKAPKYKTGGDVNNALLVQIVPFLEEFLRSFDDLSHGIPITKTPIVGTATLFDPSRAPQGKHTVFLYEYEPYHLKEGGAGYWDEIKQEIADGVLATVQNQATNMNSENILGRSISSPLDLERQNPAFWEGSIGHLGVHLSQHMSNRPLPGWSQYRTPVKNLYMCGASTHPGAGVSGGGRASVQTIMQDLGIDFQKVVSK